MDIKLTDLILHVPGFLSAEHCDFLIEEHRRFESQADLEHCPEANTNVDTYSSYQRIVLTPHTEAWNIVHSATETMINRYHQYLETFGAFHIGRRGSMIYSHMYRLLKYPVGAKIHPHTDHDAFIYGSCTFNLNEDYEGGEFAWFKGQHRVKLGRGDALIFPADFFWVHEVEEVTRGVRYSTNSFLQSIPQHLRETVQAQVKEQMDLIHSQGDPEQYRIKGFNC